jgi:20S proteasome subunit beta 4
MYGTLGVVPYAAHGYGAFFALSTMDRYHRPDMTLPEAMEVLRRCVDELEKRFIVNLGVFKVRVADKDGVREVDLQGNDMVPPPAPVFVNTPAVIVPPVAEVVAA